MRTLFLLSLCVWLSACAAKRPRYLEGIPIGPAQQSGNETIVYTKAINMKASSLAGVVEYWTGGGIVGAKVQLTDEGCLETYRETITDENGRFDLGISESGLYYLCLAADGMKSSIYLVKVEGRARRLLTLNLEPAT